MSRQLALLVAFFASPARGGSSASACGNNAASLVSLSDFEYGLGGWSAGNTSQWAWRVGCAGDDELPCAAAGHGYVLAVGRNASLISPPLLASCASLSYFALAGVELVVDALEEGGGVLPIATLPPSRGWHTSSSLALPPRLVRVRIRARFALPDDTSAWLPAGSAGVDSVLFQLLPQADDGGGAHGGFDERAPAGGWPLAPNSALSPVGVAVSTLFAHHKIAQGKLAAIVRARGITRAKLYQYSPTLIRTLETAGVREMVVGIPNLELRNLAISPGHADKLVAEMEPFQHLISHVAVGNEPLASWWGGEFADKLPRALAHVQAALTRRGWQARATVALQADVLVDTWPPSDAAFDSRNAELIRDVLPALLRTGSTLMVNLYPFLAWRAASGQIGLDFCTFEAAGCVKAGSECYPNMLHAMLDALQHALGKLGLRELPLMIGEVGWPTGGREPGADAHSACVFANNLVAEAAHGRTPLGLPVPPLFVFELLDEEGKSASVSTLGASERHYGLLTEAGDEKFPLLWAPQSLQAGREAAALCPPRVACSTDADCAADLAQWGTPEPVRACFEQRSAFCVPDPNATDAQVGAALSWLCAPAGAEKAGARVGSAAGGGGGVDCAPLNALGTECAGAPLRAQALWGATQYARLHGAEACSFGRAFNWVSEVPPTMLEMACPLGVCEATAVPDHPPQGRGAAGGACLVAQDCGGHLSPVRSVFVGPVCDRRPFAAAASGSCRPIDGADPDQLISAMDWACSVGGVNCSAMRTLCASAPLRERATWVFSQYASTKGGGGGGACSFAGIAKLSDVPLAEAAPLCDIGVCHMPSQTVWQSPLFGALLVLLVGGYAAMRLRASTRLEQQRAEALRLDCEQADLRLDESTRSGGVDGGAAQPGARDTTGADETDEAPARAAAPAPMWRGKSTEMQML